MEKAGYATFSKIKANNEIAIVGHEMHVTNEDYKMLLDDGLQASPEQMKRYLHLKA